MPTKLRNFCDIKVFFWLKFNRIQESFNDNCVFYIALTFNMFSYPTFSMLLTLELIYSTFWNDFEPQSFDFKHKGTKEWSFFSGNKDNKRLKSRHKALRMKNFVAFVKAALAALCIFRSRKNIVSLCLCVKKTLPNLNS